MASQKLSSDARLSWSAGLPGGSGGVAAWIAAAVRRNGLLGEGKERQGYGVCVAASRERGAPRTNTRSWGWGFGQISDGLGNGYDGSRAL